MTGAATIVECIERLSAARVVCIGDVMLDRFVYGEVERISPEAPVPVCRVTSEAAMLGGAGNVIRNLVALGARADFVGVVGDDEPGGDIARLLHELDGVAVALLRDSTRHTTIKTRYFAAAQQLLRADQESIEAVSDALADELFAAAEAAFAGAGALVLSDYGKGVLTDALTARLIAAAKAAGLAVIVDPKGDDYAPYRGATLVTPNRSELARATGLPTGTDQEAAAAAARCIDECGLDGILVTRGADGMTLLGAGGAEPLHLASDAREVFDVSGAGDTVVAAVAAALAAGIELADAVYLANLAAGIVVGKIGTAVAYAADVLDAARRQDLFGPGEGKVLSLDAAVDRVGSWRHRGERIGFTNGCFDLIHPGHVALLARSRAACDRLVVGLNSDSSTRRLKGDSRPVQAEAARAAVLASLASVDLVIIFAEDTPIRLIEALRPEILAKGADYTIDQVVGGDVVRAYGGEVVLVDLEPGHSTTATIERMSR